MSSSMSSFLTLSLASAVGAKSFLNLSPAVSVIFGVLTFGGCFVAQSFSPEKSKSKSKKKKKKKKVESSSDESSSEDSSSSDDSSDESSEEEVVVVKKKPVEKKPVEKKLSKGQKKALKKKRAKEEAEKKKKEALAAEEAARKKKEEEAKKKENAKKTAEKQNKKKLSKKQKKRLAIAAAKEKEENERIEKEKKQKELEAAAAKKTSDEQAEGKKKKRKKKKKKAPVETAPVETAVEAAVTEVVVEEPEDDDGWQKVGPSKRKKQAKKNKSSAAAAQTEGKDDFPKGPIVQEVLDLGTKPIDRDATDEARQTIMSVLGFPPRPSKKGGGNDDQQMPGRREAKWLRNVGLFKTKLNVIMEFKETKSKYYLLMNGTPSSCQDAIKAAQQLFDQGYSDILTPGMTQDTMLVESKARGAVVGKGAENIKAIQAEYSVNIQLPPRIGTSDVVTLSGPTEGVKMAKIAIKQLMETGISDCTHPDSSVRSVMVPNRRKWILIGTKGSNIRRIQETYECRITVPQNVEGQKPDDLVAVMVAGNKAQLDGAVADIKESIAEPEPEQIPGFSKELTCEIDPWSED